MTNYSQYFVVWKREALESETRNSRIHIITRSINPILCRFVVSFLHLQTPARRRYHRVPLSNTGPDIADVPCTNTCKTSISMLNSERMYNCTTSFPQLNAGMQVLIFRMGADTRGARNHSQLCDAVSIRYNCSLGLVRFNTVHFASLGSTADATVVDAKFSIIHELAVKFKLQEILQRCVCVV